MKRAALVLGLFVSAAVAHAQSMAPQQVAYSYQVVVADRGERRLTDNPNLDALLRDALARDSLKYTGFTLVRNGVMLPERGNTVEILYRDVHYKLVIRAREASATSQDAVRLDVLLTRQTVAEGRVSKDGDVILQASDVNIPMGLTVVLGSREIDTNRAIIVIIRPDVCNQPTHNLNRVGHTPDCSA